LNDGLQVHVTLWLPHHGAEGVNDDDGWVGLFNFRSFGESAARAKRLRRSAFLGI
jgi:hypothetical protein